MDTLVACLLQTLSEESVSARRPPAEQASRPVLQHFRRNTSGQGVQPSSALVRIRLRCLRGSGEVKNERAVRAAKKQPKELWIIRFGQQLKDFRHSSRGKNASFPSTANHSEPAASSPSFRGIREIQQLALHKTSNLLLLPRHIFQV
jgi:hypothetical protein